MRFDVKVMDQAGAVRVLSVDVSDSAAAVRHAESLGVVVLGVRRRSVAFSRRAKRFGTFALLLFSQELLALLDSGLPLLEALEALAEKEHNASVHYVLSKVISALREGKTFSAALDGFPEIFPPLYVASVRASEKTGDLSEALMRYVRYQAQVDVVRKKVISASIYPVLLLLVGGLVTLFLMTYVVPRFSVIYESNEQSLPFLSRVLLDWGRMWAEHAMQILLVAGLLVAGLVGFLAQARVRQRLWQYLWGLPTLGERMFVYQLTRFYRTLAMLLKSGIPVVNSMDMVVDLLDVNLRQRLRAAQQNIREGQSISVALEQNGLTTPIASRMLRVGERSGQMGDMMERIAAFYDEDLARWVEWFAKLFEPILMALIGVMIGVIVVLMYLPVFELAGSIG